MTDLPPVQVIKQPTPELSELESLLRVDNSIDRPDSNLWVISAGDDQVTKYVVNALVHGKQ